MYIESNYDSELQFSVLSGTLMINDEIIDTEIGIKPNTNRMFFSCEQYSLILSADYKINKDGNMVLKRINYDEEVDWQSTPKKILLTQVETQGDGSVS